MIALSFILFLTLFLGIGLLSAFKSRGHSHDYLVASSSISPWAVALSAVATNNSGYMFIGMIGFTYLTGLSSIWLMIGWIVGDLIASQFIHKKLRVATGEQKIMSFGGVIGNWYGDEFRKLRFLVGSITLVFLSIYAAAQLKAGGKALHVLLGWDYSSGAIIGAIMVFLYCLAGGIRASIWTDVAQSFVMIIAMFSILAMGIFQLGGISSFWQALGSVSDSYLSLSPANMPIPGATGFVLFILGWLFAGFGVVGQPHIMVRFMTLDHSKNINRVRLYYYSWFTAFYTMTIGAGLLARLLLGNAGTFDEELALPLIALELLHPLFVGLVLAGLFAATMSTADSLILSCSAAMVRDLTYRWRGHYLMVKICTFLVTTFSLLVALYGTENVFNLVLIAWSVLAASFGPLIFIYSCGGRASEYQGIITVLAGFATTILWRMTGLNSIIYEVAPGIISGLCTYYLMRKLKILE